MYKFLNVTICLTVCFTFGFEEKTFFQKYYDIVLFTFSGGGLSIIYWLVFGCIGIATGGTAFGIGIIPIILFGTSAGLGIGSFYHIITNPSNYNINLYVITTSLTTMLFIHYLIKRKERER